MVMKLDKFSFLWNVGCFICTTYIVMGKAVQFLINHIIWFLTSLPTISYLILIQKNVENLLQFEFAIWKRFISVIVHATDRGSQRVSFDLNGTEKSLKEETSHDQVNIFRCIY